MSALRTTFLTVSIFFYQWQNITYLLMPNNNFIKCLVLKAFIIQKVKNATKIRITLVFLYEIYFLLAHFYLNVI